MDQKKEKRKEKYFFYVAPKAMTKRRTGAAMHVKEEELQWVRQNWQSEAEAMRLEIAGKGNCDCWECE